MSNWFGSSGRAQRFACRRDRKGCEATDASLHGGRSRQPASSDECRECRASRAALCVGFTLIEVLIALAIVSIALLAALRAAGQGTSNVEALRLRLLAGWVAENVLAEQRARGDWPPPGILRGAEHQGGIAFAWREEVIATPNARFRRVDIRVFTPPGETQQLSHLTGFLVDPPGMRP